MHKLYELKDMLCEELEEYGSKGKLDVGSLDIVDKLAHAIKNIDKIIECAEDEEYSNGYVYNDGTMMGGTSYARGGRRASRSYARGRTGNVRRDNMGRYSRDNNEFMMDLRELMEDAPNDHIKQKIQSIMSEM